MKIDIHVHTKKCKGGDAESRNIDADKFYEIIRLTDVKVLAITNHNHFDLEQYTKIKDKSEDVCQIWPGIELDILEEDRRAHLILIANPKNVEEFDKTVQRLLTGKTVAFPFFHHDFIKTFTSNLYSSDGNLVSDLFNF